MRISDWSSDVCSSDLDNVARQAQGHRFRPILLLHRSKLNRVAIAGHQELSVQARVSRARPATSRLGFLPVLGVMDWQYEIGRASCRARVSQYVSISVVAGSLQNTI